MPVRLLTLDCAGTLLRGAWDPVGFALWAANESGLVLPPNAATEYGALLHLHYPDILAANRTGDTAAVHVAYVRLGEAWLDRLCLAPSLSPKVVEASERLLVSRELFEPFEDTVPFLTEARRRGLRLAIASNWDVSLPRVLEAHSLLDLVDEVYASLVVGAEKPDPAMLRLAMTSAGVSPEETVHVGDNPTDDLGAAAKAGVRGLLLQRSSPLLQGGEEGPPRDAAEGRPRWMGVRGIGCLTEVFDWIG